MTVDEYLRRAQECEAQARTAVADEIREGFRKLAAEWRRLAAARTPPNRSEGYPKCAGAEP